ncbi:MAG TPA: hypothetical protein PKL13_01825 [bacterium]|nr:hypothetical protein [bacterium]
MKKLIFLIFLLIFGSFFISPVFSQDYDPDFNKNNIISDFQMFDYNSMTQAQIQQFLQGKNSYLANYSTEDFEGIPKSASQIIYEAAQRYKVNPKYILVTLQKEQSLIQWEGVPPQKRLDWACGYAVCDSCSMSDPKIQKYKGFGKQIDNTAGAMRFYYDSVAAYGFIKKSGVNTIIDGENLIFANQATANLYTYTPHIRGNYTFWRVWQRYFGDPLSGSRESVASISTEYMLQIIGSSENEINAKEGEVVAYWVEYLNIGTQTWTNEDLKKLYLIDTKYKTKIPIISKNSTFIADDTIRSDIKVYSQRQSVKPGEVLRITVTEKSDYEKIKAHSYMLVYDGRGWFADSDINFNVKTQFNYDATYQDGVPTSMEPLKKYNMKIKYKNTGLSTWNKNNVKMKYISSEGKETYVSMTQNSVAPNKIAEFVIMDTPKSAGQRTYSFSLYRQVDKTTTNKFPSGDYNAKTNVTVKLGAQLVSHNIPSTMKPGEIIPVTVKFKNAGTDKWDKNLVFRAYDKVNPFVKSIFKSSDWESAYAIKTIKGDVNSGEEYSFTFNLKAPTKVGKYPIYLQLEWGKKFQEIIIDDVMSKKFIIDVGREASVVKTDTSKIKSAQGISFDLPQTMKSGEIKTVNLILKNNSNSVWDSNYVLRAYKSTNPFSGSNFYDSSWLSVMAVDKIRNNINPGGLYSFTFKIQAPVIPGIYKLYMQFEYGSKYEEIAIDGEKTKEYSIEVK